MQKYLVALTIGAIGFTMLMNGCAKRVKPEAPVSGVEEEEIMEAPEISEPVAPMDSQAIQEEDMGIEGAARLTDIYFDFDKFNIREDMKASMQSNAKWLTSNPGVAVMIEGHADERGTNEYNLALGERRAQAAKRFLIALGVKASQINTISYGEERPTCMERQENCYSKNRRAHFTARG
jgi:peptidoglycan-associated lipoprotein